MKNKLHRHLVTCRLCQLEQGHYCPALSEKTAQGMRERARTDPVGFAEEIKGRALILINAAGRKAA